MGQGIKFNPVDRLSDRTLEVLIVVVAVATALVLLFYGVIAVNPYVPFNPFPPPAKPGGRAWRDAHPHGEADGAGLPAHLDANASARAHQHADAQANQHPSADPDSHLDGHLDSDAPAHGHSHVDGHAGAAHAASAAPNPHAGAALHARWDVGWPQLHLVWVPRCDLGGQRPAAFWRAGEGLARGWGGHHFRRLQPGWDLPDSHQRERCHRPLVGAGLGERPACLQGGGCGYGRRV